jgi:Uncharacterized conserved protein
LALIVLVLALRKKRTAAVICSAFIALSIYACSTNAIANLFLLPLENQYKPIEASDSAKAIVVLGGGYNDASPEYAMEGALLDSALSRAIYGFELNRRFNLPLTYTGGKGYDSRVPGTESEAARRLWLELGVRAQDITIETDSLDTKGNASGVAKLINQKEIILVTSAFHMPRSVLTFQKAGFIVHPAPTDYRAKRSPLSWADFLPEPSKVRLVTLALHEYVGLLYYRMTL